MNNIKPKGKTVATTNLYSDLDLLFKAHPITGDVGRRVDSDAVKRAVKNIILTNAYERPFKPGFGGNVRGLLFELNTDRGMRRVALDMVETINTFEPRVENVDVKFDEGEINSNKLNINISYSIKNGVKNQQLSVAVNRVR
jgi:phage baseplate assembly protein W